MLLSSPQFIVNSLCCCKANLNGTVQNSANARVPFGVHNYMPAKHVELVGVVRESGFG